MYGIIKNVIESKSFELSAILKKTNKLWAESEFTDEQRDELIALARKNAKAENSYAPLQEQIEKVALEVKTLREEVAALKNSGVTEDEEPTEEYPEYVQPTGAHDSYKVGDKITYNGKQYECQKDNCVWNPDDYPQGWKLVETE